jgi:hypothetical protein
MNRQTRKSANREVIKKVGWVLVDDEAADLTSARVFCVL